MKIQIGAKIPNFSAIDTNGATFESETVLGKKAIVLYFYPKDDTPGCTIQACTFRDQYEDFVDLGAEIIGVSSDSVTAHQKFVKKYNLPFILLSDSDKKLRKLFEVPNDLFGLLPGRVTYVINKEGVLEYIFDSMTAKSHITKALAILRKSK